MSYVARCRYCGHHGPSMVRSPGSIVLEVVLWLAPVALFIGAQLVEILTVVVVGAPASVLPSGPPWWTWTLLAAWYSARRRLDRRPECEVCRVPYPEPEPDPRTKPAGDLT